MRLFFSIILFTISLLITFSLSAQIADKYLEDDGIGDDPAVLLHDDFENGYSSDWNNRDEDANIITDVSKSNNGNSYTHVIPHIGKDYDSDFEFHPSPTLEEIYVRYYVKFDLQTDWPHHMGGITAKVPGFWGSAGLAPPGDKAFWSSLEPIALDGGPKRWGFYTYWHEMHSWANLDGSPSSNCLANNTCYYGNVFVPEKPGIEKNRWYCIEAMMKSNTPHQYNGEQAFWVDGELYGHWKTGQPTGHWLRDKFYTFGIYFDPNDAYHFEGYNWRTSDEVKISSIQLQWYVSTDQETTDIVYYDDVVVATERIGCINKTGETRDPGDGDDDDDGNNSGTNPDGDSPQFSISGGCGKIDMDSKQKSLTLIILLGLGILASIAMIPREN